MKKLLLILLLAFSGQASAAFTYEGAITTPDAAPSLYSSSLPMAMTYDVNCFGGVDPSPNDGQPGCIGTMGNWGPNKGWIPTIFETFDIVPPVITAPVNRTQGNISSLPKGQVIYPRFDPTRRANGSSIFDELDGQPGYDNRWMPGVAMLPDGRLVTTCGSDWYNTGRTNFPTHCIATITNGVATAFGPYDFTSPDTVAANAKPMSISEYVTYIDQTWADANLGAAGEYWCMSGMHRTPGNSNVQESQGTALYAWPCGSMTNESGGTIDVVPLTFYDVTGVTSVGDPNKFPDRFTTYAYGPHTKTKDITWGNYNGEEGVFVTVEEAAASIPETLWWYGFPNPWDDPHAHRNSCGMHTIDNPTGDVCCTGTNCRDSSLDFISDQGVAVWQVYGAGTCGTSCQTEFDSWGPDIPVDYVDFCQSAKGNHATNINSPYEIATVLFFKGSDLAISAATSQGTPPNWDHLDDVPYEIVTEMDDFEGMWEVNCRSARGITNDPVTGRFFISETFENRWIIHVFSTDAAAAPVLTSPTAQATSSTTATGSIFTNASTGTLYSLVSENASELAATIKAGDSQAVSVIGEQNVSETGLTDATLYYYHFIHNTVDGDSNIVVASFNTGSVDTTAPVAGNVTAVAPTTGSKDSSLTVTWGISTDETALDTVVLEYSVDDGGAPSQWYYRADVSAAGGSTDITALPPSFAMWFRVRATDISGNTHTGAELNSATLPLQTAPDLTMKSTPSGDLELPDTDPSQFSFVDQTGVTAGNTITSDPIIVMGIDSFAEAPITVLDPEGVVTGGEYSINGGAWTAIPGTVMLNDSVRVRLIAHPDPGFDENAYLTIGTTQDIFTAVTGP